MRAAVAGWAWRTPLGRDVEAVTAALLDGKRALRVNPRHDVSTYACKLAAVVEGEPAPSRHRRFLGRMGLFAVEVAREALAHAGQGDGPRVGLFAGVGGLRAHWNAMMPALAGQRSDGSDAWERGLKGIHPFWMLQHLSNNAHALAAEELGTRGEGATFAGATGGAQALAAAIRALVAGAVDAAVVVACDTLLEPETLVELAARGAATCAASVEECAPPYDVCAAGFVPGEAAAAVVLRRPEECERSLAFVSARAVADGSRAEPEAATLARAAAGFVAPVVDGAGFARPQLDVGERAALAGVVGQDARLSSLSASLGALGASTAVVQVVALAAQLRAGRLAPVAGLGGAAPGPLAPLARACAATGKSAIGVSGGAPGLAAAVHVEVP